MLLPHIAARLFGAPLMIACAKLDIILGVLTPRLLGENLPTVAPLLARGYDITPEGIAIISILGTLVRRTVGLEAQSGLTSYGGISQQLQQAVSDPLVKAILLDIDSPGGEAGGVFDLADQIYAARQSKPVWAVANEEAFSAAYALAAATNKIYVPRTSGVGSIGVIAMHLDQSQADADEGLNYTAIYAGAHKNDMSPHEPLSDPARITIQSEVDRVYDLFVQTVARGRKLSIETVKATEAALFFGDQAVASGLADKLGTFDDALQDLTTALTPRSLRALSSPTTNPNRKAETMTDPVETLTQALEANAAPTPHVPDIEAVKAQAKTEALAYVAEVNELCELAGMQGKAAAFIAKAVPVAEIRKALLTARAAESEATALVGQLPSNALANPAAEPKIDTAAIYANRNNPKGE